MGSSFVWCIIVSGALLCWWHYGVRGAIVSGALLCCGRLCREAIVSGSYCVKGILCLGAICVGVLLFWCAIVSGVLWCGGACVVALVWRHLCGLYCVRVSIMSGALYVAPTAVYTHPPRCRQHEMAPFWMPNLCRSLL